MMLTKLLLRQRLTFVLALTAASLSAHDCEVDGIFYNLDKKGKTATVTYFGDDNGSARYKGAVDIPATFSFEGATYTVTAIGSYAFNNCKELSSIYLPASIATVGKQAFAGCTGIKKTMTASMEGYAKIRFEDEYSAPHRYTEGEVVEEQMSAEADVRFSAPTITLDEPALHDENLVFFNGWKYSLNYDFQIPGEEVADRHAALLLFKETDCGLEEARSRFLKLWKRNKDIPLSQGKGTINMRVEKYFGLNGRFACYHVSAKMQDSPSFRRTNTNADLIGQKALSQHHDLVSGIDHYFVVDTQRRQLVGFAEMFNPNIAEQLTNRFGKMASLRADDRSLLIKSKAGEGRFLFTEITKKHFSDYFRNLVGWDHLYYDTPEYFDGEEGLKAFLRKEFIYEAAPDEAFDPVEVSLTVMEDGSIGAKRVTGATVYCPEEKLLKACGKMPNWKPAYTEGKPVAKEYTFTIKAPRWLAKAEIMPEFPDGGKEGLTKFLSKNLRYPRGAEENGIQGRVACSFIVEEDGSITELKVVRRVHPLLDSEALRLLSEMPRWKPGMQEGRPVRVKFNIPITFRLQ